MKNPVKTVICCWITGRGVVEVMKVLEQRAKRKPIPAKVAKLLRIRHLVWEK